MPRPYPHCKVRPSASDGKNPWLSRGEAEARGMGCYITLRVCVYHFPVMGAAKVRDREQMAVRPR